MCFQRVDKPPEEPIPPACVRCGHFRRVVRGQAGEELLVDCERCGATHVLVSKASQRGDEANGLEA